MATKPNFGDSRFTICFHDDFHRQTSAAPPKVITQLVTKAYPRLRNDPTTPTGDMVKKLKRWKDLYRYRLGKHRLIYRVDLTSQVVTLCLLGNRNSVYDRLGHDSQNDKPLSRVIADQSLHSLLERMPSSEEVGQAVLDAANENSPPPPRGETDAALPRAIDKEMLISLRIEEAHHEMLLACHTEGDLLECGASQQSTEAVMNILWPKPIDQIIDSPKREVPSQKAFEDLVEGERELTSFLLALDDSQKPLTDRFNKKGKDLPIGPWIVKGGPGSGKSTVALYCIRNLLKPDDAQTAFPSMELPPPRILFTTYTKTLVKVSEYLLDALEVSNNQSMLHSLHADDLCSAHLPPGWNKRPLAKNDNGCKPLVQSALTASNDQAPGSAFSIDEHEFLIDEVNDVIVGNEIATLEEYQSFERTGRGRPLGKQQREQLWRFWEKLEEILDEQRRCLFNQRFVAAREHISSNDALYEYVFIDEAQDLSPAALRMCIALCKPNAAGKANVFLTADRNQSIYGSGAFSWKRVAEDLDFRGRTTIFRLNYRTTHEIVDAIRPLLSKDNESDHDTLDDKPVRHGDDPELYFATSSDSEVEQLTNWLTTTLLEERLDRQCAAILCPTRNKGQQIAESLPKTFNAEFLTGEQLDLRHRGVTVTTMHGAKGLEFPLVSVVGLEKGLMPWKARGGTDQGEIDATMRRLFYVACSRAMYRLLVIGNKSRPSKFLDELDQDHWGIIDE